MLSISTNLARGHYGGYLKNGKYQISQRLLEACTTSDLLEAWSPQDSPNGIEDSPRSSTHMVFYLNNMNEQNSFFNEQSYRSSHCSLFNPGSHP